MVARGIFHQPKFLFDDTPAFSFLTLQMNQILSKSEILILLF